MFDVGFSELIVIAIVALVVIGPERLPKVARTAGLLLGRLQRYVNDVKADIKREMQASVTTAIGALKLVGTNQLSRIFTMQSAQNRTWSLPPEMRYGVFIFTISGRNGI